MIVLDTNIVSELLRDKPNMKVVDWIDSNAINFVFTTSVTIMEIQYGIKLLPEGKRKVELEIKYQQWLLKFTVGKILNFDEKSAYHAAHLMAKRKFTSHPFDWRDAQIAGIVVSNKATLATRNVKDFEGCDFMLLNPFE